MAKGCDGPSLGAMRHVATLRQRTRESDGCGGFQDIWADLFTFRCAVVETTGKETFKQQHIVTEETLKFTTRYDSRFTAVNGNLRIFFDSLVWNIDWVNNLKYRNEWMEIKGRLDIPASKDPGIVEGNLLLETTGDLLLEDGEVLLIE